MHLLFFYSHHLEHVICIFLRPQMLSVHLYFCKISMVWFAFHKPHLSLKKGTSCYKWILAGQLYLNVLQQDLVFCKIDSELLCLGYKVTKHNPDGSIGNGRVCE